jgi:hypothetical protein
MTWWLIFSMLMIATHPVFGVVASIVLGVVMISMADV